VKEICGYIALNQHLDNNQSNDICLLSVDSIQLVRFHHHQEEKSKADSVKSDTLRTASPQAADSVQIDKTPLGKPRRITKF
jgi:hypothetical protein